MTTATNQNEKDINPSLKQAQLKEGINPRDPNKQTQDPLPQKKNK